MVSFYNRATAAKILTGFAASFSDPRSFFQKYKPGIGGTIRLPYSHAFIVGRKLVPLLQRVVVNRISRRSAYPLDFFPERRDINAFARAHPPPKPVGHVCEKFAAFIAKHAKKWAGSFDPVNLLGLLEAAAHLRNQAGLEESAKKLLAALWPKSWRKKFEVLQERGLIFPSHGILQRSRPGLDVTCMLLERREISSIDWEVATTSAHVICDSSPISGSDLFAMFLEV